jgi:hypothetical protein
MCSGTRRRRPLVDWSKASLLASLTCGLLASPVEALEVAVHFQSPPGDAVPISVRALPVGASLEATSVAHVSLLPPYRGSLPLDLERNWLIELEARGFWAPLEEWGGRDRPKSLVLSAWPAGRLLARLQAGATRGIPPSARVRLIAASPPSGGPRQPPDTELVCPVDEESRVDCPIPAGVWHVRLKPMGFLPTFRWNQRIGPGETADFGKQVLRRGASIFGQVVVEDGPLDPDALSVRARRLTDPVRSRAEQDASRQHEYSTRVNAWGYFEFAGVEPGAYEITAQQPDTAPSTIRPVEVESDTASELRAPIVLRRPATLEVVVEPALDPFGVPWTLALLRPDPLSPSLSEVVIRGSSDEAGNWRVPGLPRERFDLELRDSKASVWSTRQVEVVGGNELVVVELRTVRVSGSVRLGDDPLRAELVFSDPDGSAEFRTDAWDDGSFEVVLTRAGRWLVDIRSAAPAVDRRRVAIEVRPNRSGRASIALCLPGVRVAGEVVDERGAPVPGARVELTAHDASRRGSSFEARNDGTFEGYGLEPGAYDVTAKAAGLRSEPTLVTLHEDLDPLELRLVVRSTRTLKGQVWSSGGPVAGAQVYALAIGAAGALTQPNLARARSGVDGLFSLEVPGGSAAVGIVAFSPGRALGVALANDLEASSNLVVALEARGGTVRLRTPAGREPESAPSGLLVIDGVAIDLGLLRPWIDANRGSWETGAVTIPAMPAAEYLFCPASPAEVLAVLSGRAAIREAACVGGFLSGDGGLVLDAAR